MDTERTAAAAEWVYLLRDVDQACRLCGEPLRAAQAAGYINGMAVHARCYPETKPA